MHIIFFFYCLNMYFSVGHRIKFYILHILYIFYIKTYIYILPTLHIYIYIYIYIYICRYVNCLSYFASFKFQDLALLSLDNNVLKKNNKCKFYLKCVTFFIGIFINIDLSQKHDISQRHQFRFATNFDNLNYFKYSKIVFNYPISCKKNVLMC